MKRLDAKVVRELARGKWLEILASLAGDVLGDALTVRPGRHVDCPFHGGTLDFRLDGPRSKYGSAAETGGAICTCGKWRDGFALLMEARKWNFREALEEVANYLGVSVDPRKSVELHKKVEESRRRSELAQIERDKKRVQTDSYAIDLLKKSWDQSKPLHEPTALPVHLYFANRGLTVSAVDHNNDLRFHPKMDCYQPDGSDSRKLVNMGRHPALLSMIRDAAGNPVTLHRTYLTVGGNKLPVTKPKKLMLSPSTAKLQGGAIRLFPAARLLGVSEGIETAMSVQFATGMPVWSCISASLLGEFIPPEGVEEIVIWADKDRSKAGIEAAMKLKKRLTENGYKVVILLPDMPIPDNKKSVDWADVWYWTGAIGFPRWIPKLVQCA